MTDTATISKRARSRALRAIDLALANGWTYNGPRDAEIVARVRAGSSDAFDLIPFAGINGSIASTAGNYLVDVCGVDPANI